ncbi:MAG: PEP-utilizing enzyme [Acidimicrobiia bacterium]
MLQGGELFPGWRPPEGDIGGAGTDAPAPFGDEDRDRLWVRDFHWPRGFTPLGMTTFATTYARTTHEAAVRQKIPYTDGIAVRFLGPFPYISPRSPEASAREARQPGFRAAGEKRLRGFQRRWRSRTRQLDAEFARLMGAVASTPTELAPLLQAAVRHEHHAWRIHFEEMYVLLVGHLDYRDQMSRLGVPAEVADACLAGYPTRMAAGDLAVFDLARSRATMAAAGDDLDARLAEIVAVHGDRAEGIADVGCPSWRERSQILLERVRLVGAGGVPPTTEVLAQRRWAARDTARSLSSRPAEIEALLAEAEKANWIWWNEEHNAVIDLRATLPLRKHALEAGRMLFDDPGDALLCAIEELMGALDGQGAPPACLRDKRRDWLELWRGWSTELPATLGNGTLLRSDPILAEIFGLPHGAGPVDHQVVVGLAASPGRVEGTARVVLAADDLVSLRPGDVLVCPGTSPNWASAFAVASAVVCDGGGLTTHAAISARDYGIPCVVGTQSATRRLRTGDRVTVDGSAGTVSLL